MYVSQITVSELGLILVMLVSLLSKYQWKQINALIMPMIIKKTLTNNTVYTVQELQASPQSLKVPL